MAANIMEMLKQIQQNQQECMKNLNDMSDKFSVIERKINDLDAKVNQHQVLETVGRLEEEVKKNNMFLFGNETDVNFEDSVAELPKIGNRADPRIAPNEEPEHGEDIEIPGFRNPSKVSSVKNNDGNPIENNQNDLVQIEDSDKEKTEELTFLEDVNANITTSIEESADISSTLDISPDTNFIAEQINKLNIKLNRMTDMFQSEFRDMEELIMDIVTEVKISIEDTLSAVCKHNNEYISETCAAVNEIKKSELSTIIEMRELMEDIANVKVGAKDTSKVCRKTTIQISPTHFSEDQIDKLNNELKRICELYQDTNVCPIIEVIPGDEHPILKQLHEGVYYEEINYSNESLLFNVKLGTDGFERSDVLDLMADHPDLSFNDVVMAFLKGSKKWEKNSKIYDFTKPMVYNKYGNLIRLRW